MVAIELVNKPPGQGIKGAPGGLQNLLTEGHQPSQGPSGDARKNLPPLGWSGRFQEKGCPILCEGIELKAENADLGTRDHRPRTGTAAKADRNRPIRGLGDV